MDHNRKILLKLLKCASYESSGKFVRSETAEHSEVECFWLSAQNLVNYMFRKAVWGLLCKKNSQPMQLKHLIRVISGDCTDLCVDSSAAGKINEL